MVRMLRAAAITLVWLCCAVSALADASQPIGYSVSARYDGGRFFPATPGSNDAYLIRERAPWDPGAPVILRLRGTAIVRSSAVGGADVLAALPYQSGLIAVLHDRSGYTVVTLDTSLVITSRITVPIEHREGQAPSAMIMGMSDGSTLLTLIGSTLCAVSMRDASVVSVRTIEQGVSGGALITIGELRSCYVHQVGAGAVLAVTDSALHVRAFAPVPRSLRSRILQCGSRIAVLTPIGDNKATQVTLVDPRTSRTEYATVDAPVDVVTAYEHDSTVMIALVRTLDDRYELVVRTFGQVSDLTNEPIGERLTIRYFQPMALRRVDDALYLVFSGGLFTATLDGSITSSDDLPNDAVGAGTEAVPTGENLVLRGDRGSLILSRTEHPFWMVVSVVRDTARYAVPIILLLIIGVVLLRYRRQHRLLDAMMDLPGSGMVIWIDANGKLVRANQSASVALGITPSVPMRRLIQYYMQNAALAELLEFTSAVQATRGAMSEKVSIQLEGAAREYVFSSVPLRTAVGRYLGCVITGVDITEALERKRLVNWAQLAHDMQTNLSTIRLNAEQLDDATPQNIERRRRILYQVGILIQRVRDLVAVGRSDELDRSMVHSAELCTEIRHEFDPAVFPHVTFSMKLRGTMMVVDRQKIMRAIRNAVENGIKAMRGEPGVIEMATWFDRTNVYIRISDTGVGMDASTLQNMMKPYFTTAHDGGGTGIGTMIMQHVVHAHGGSLRVTSEPGKGTQIVFRIPHGMEPLRKRVTEDVLEDAL